MAHRQLFRDSGGERRVNAEVTREDVMRRTQIVRPTLTRACVVVFLLAAVGCGGGTSVTSPSTIGSVSATQVSLTKCQTPAAPLPGWLNCPGTITLSITETISSGTVSVYMNYLGNSFFHGQLAVGAGIPGSVSVPVNDDYVSNCTAGPLSTTVDVYNGPSTNPTAPKLSSTPFTLNITCT
jgi:hypothetical protein